MSWVFETKLVAADGVLNDGFASSVSLYRKIVVTGDEAFVIVSGAPASSAAYVMIYDPRTSAWSQNSKLLGAGGDQFGASVAVYEDVIAVGSPSASGGAGGVSTYQASNVSNRVVWSLQSSVSI